MDRSADPMFYFVLFPTRLIPNQWNHSFTDNPHDASLHYRKYSVSIRVRALCLSHRNALASISALQTKHESKTLCSNDANSISKPRIGRITRMTSLRYSYSGNSCYWWSNLFAEIPRSLASGYEYSCALK